MNGQRIAVVTGSASGIGKAAAERLEANGHRIISVDRQNADIIADLSSDEGRSSAIAAVRERTDRIDALVASAGINRPMDSATIVAINYFGAVKLIDGLHDLLAASPAPRVVAVTSTAVLMPVDDATVSACLAGDEASALDHAARAGQAQPDQPVIYASSKRALGEWIRRSSVEPRWIEQGILLNGICPGVFATPLTQGDLDDPVRGPVLRSRNPGIMKDIPGPEAIAGMIAQMAAEDNGYMVGQLVFVDGGAEVRRRLAGNLP